MGAPLVLLLRDARSPLPDLADTTEQERKEQAKRQEPWRVVLHNDDVTPMEYVVNLLHDVFDLGWWKATLTMLRAHAAGVAAVGSFPKDEAERRIATAHGRARRDGWPLRLSAEPGDGD